LKPTPSSFHNVFGDQNFHSTLSPNADLARFVEKILIVDTNLLY
jgi:hypothetical protein